jgi:hypothetical protein
MLFSAIKIIDVRQIGRSGTAHFLRRPILEGISGRSFYRMLYDPARTSRFRKALPNTQVQTRKQAKKDGACYGQADEHLLS